MLTYFAGYLIAAQVGGRIFDARGAKPTILLGCLVSAGGLLWWASQVTALDDTWISRLPIAVAGAGIGLMLGPASADAVSRATHSSYGEVTGVNQTIRNYGAALSFAILGTILTHTYVGRFSDSLVDLGVSRPTAREIATNATSGTESGHSSIPESMRAAVERAVAEDFADGIRGVLIAMAVALAVAFFLGLRHHGGRPALTATPSPAPERSSTL